MLAATLHLCGAFGLTLTTIMAAMWGNLKGPDGQKDENLDFFRRFGALAMGSLAAWAWADLIVTFLGKV